jgi:hypothetical protein
MHGLQGCASLRHAYMCLNTFTNILACSCYASPAMSVEHQDQHTLKKGSLAFSGLLLHGSLFLWCTISIKVLTMLVRLEIKTAHSNEQMTLRAGCL